MKTLSSAAIGALLLLTACGSIEPQTSSAMLTEETSDAEVVLTPDAEAIKAHMSYLASDELAGREAGTEGYDAAAAYVAAEFERLGVTPAGTDGSYYQTVPLRRSYRGSEDLSMSITNPDGTPLALEQYADHVVYGSTRFEESHIEAEAVFVGYGVVAPDLGRDDYAGLDINGKIVFMLSGTPSGIQTEERAFYGTRKAAEASKRGAIGIVSVETPTRRKIYSFARLVGEGRLDGARMSWLTPEGETFTRAPNIQANAYLSLEGAAKVFAAAGHEFETIIAASEAEGGMVEGFDLPYTVSISQNSALDTVQSDNVIGLIEGSDPDLENEVIVLTAHLDHIGISKSFEADKINNGALDNAAGVSTLLDVARMVMEGERPRRSIMLLLVTAEEKGLLGAQYFAQNPTVPAENLVANVNLDMPVLTYEFEDVVAFGADRSTIAAAVKSASESMGLALSPDPMPEQGLFTRSDHFRMVEIGVPAVFLKTGHAGDGEAAWAEHFAKNYHRPSDDMDNNINFDAAAKFAELNARIAMKLANANERPLWKAGDFFARQFNGPQEAAPAP